MSPAVLAEQGVEEIKQRLAARYMDTARMLTDLHDLVATVEDLHARLRDVQAATR